MSIESDLKTLSAEAALKREARRAGLLEKAKGRGLLSWMDFGLVLPIQWSIIRLSLRLNFLIQYLLDQPAAGEAQQGAQGGAPHATRP
ncbi:MAG: hypothetical protein ACM36A_06580 [Bacteroidota bacterium]